MPKNYEVKTTFRAVDKTSRVLGKMQTRVARFAAKASRAMKKVNKAASKVSGVVSKGLKIGFAAATGAVVGLAAAVNKTADYMDELAKKTRAIDFPIEEFQEWRFVAEQSGVSSDVFDKSLGKFTKTVGELKGGYGAMFTALKKTNPALLKQLQNTDDVSQAFELYLGAIREAPTAMDKAALSSAAFGRAGVDMINMANLSAESIAELRGQMRENGVVTAEQAAQAEKYNDMMNRLKLTITGLLINVLTPLMPILTEVANQIRAWAVENKGLISSKLKEWLQWIIENFPTIVEWMKKIGVAIGIFYGIVTAIKALNAIMLVFNAIAMANPIVLIIAAIVAAVAAIIIFRKEIKAFLIKVWEKIKEVGGAIVDFFVGIWDWVVGKITEAKDFIVGIWEFIKNTFWNGVGAIVDYFVERWEFAKAIFTAVFNGIVEFFSGIMQEIQDFFQPVIDTFVAGWELIGEVFSNVWQGIKDVARSVIDWIMEKVDLIVGGFKAIGSFLGFGDDEEEGAGAAAGGGGGGRVPKPVRPTVSLSKSSTETITRESSEVTIKDETGRAQVTRGKKARGFKLVHSGSMP